MDPVLEIKNQTAQSSFRVFNQIVSRSLAIFFGSGIKFFK